MKETISGKFPLRAVRTKTRCGHSEEKSLLRFQAEQASGQPSGSGVESVAGAHAFARIDTKARGQRRNLPWSRRRLISPGGCPSRKFARGREVRERGAQRQPGPARLRRAPGR